MKLHILKQDKRFAFAERKDRWIDVYILEDGVYKQQYRLIDKQAARQCIYSLAGLKKPITEEDFYVQEVNNIL